MPTPCYSLVVPVFNEEDGLDELASRLQDLMDELDAPAEVVLIDDGSTDNSFAAMVELNRVDDRFKILQLSRNFGHQLAITAGLDLAQGEAVVIMDADLQDPPEVVVTMAKRWREGYEVVYGVRTDRSSDSGFKRLTAVAFYRVLRGLTNVDIPFNVGDFRLVDRRVLEAVRSMREGSRFVRGIFAWVGFRQIGVPYRREERFAGSTKYPLRKMVRLAADGIIGFSQVPLRLTLQAGLTVAAASILGGFVALIMKLTGLFVVPGWASIIFVICLLGGIQLAVLGLIGEYLGRTYEEVNRRPLYIVSDVIGMDVAPAAPGRRAVVLQRTPPPIDLRDRRPRYQPQPVEPVAR